ncbi:isoprenylcysteine carboxyl methyltransferase [Botrytis cinerea]
MSADDTTNAIRGSASAHSSPEQLKSTASTSSATRRRPWDVIQNGGVAPRARVGPNREQFAEIPSIDEAITQFEKQFFPGQPKSLSGIALRSFLVGIVLTISMCATFYLFFVTNSIFWRIPSSSPLSQSFISSSFGPQRDTIPPKHLSPPFSSAVTVPHTTLHTAPPSPNF